MAEIERIYTIPQAAKQCRVNRVTLWRSVKSGKLKSFTTPGGHYRIYQEDLQAFLAERNTRPLVQGDPKGKKILIVDDEVQIRKMLIQMLTKSGYQVASAADGFEAGLQVTRFKPDLILLDLNMPTIDGFEVCRRMKEDPGTSQIKIVVLTGFATQENRTRAMRLGADAFFPKPMERATLLSKIEVLLNSEKDQLQQQVPESESETPGFLAGSRGITLV